MTAALHVVTGVVVRGERLLLTQRGTRSDYPYAWESPGGKVEKGENLLTALRRELDEEIGWPAGTFDPSPLYQTAFAEGVAQRREVRITFYLLHAAADFAPTLRDPNVAGSGWFSLEEMARVRLVPGNVRLLAHLLDAGWPR